VAFAGRLSDVLKEVFMKTSSEISNEDISHTKELLDKLSLLKVSFFDRF
jgi:hypothetical protein